MIAGVIRGIAHIILWRSVRNGKQDVKNVSENMSIQRVCSGMAPNEIIMINDEASVVLIE